MRPWRANSDVSAMGYRQVETERQLFCGLFWERCENSRSGEVSSSNDETQRTIIFASIQRQCRKISNIYVSLNSPNSHLLSFSVPNEFSEDVLPVAISDDGRHVAVVNDRHFLELHQTTDEDSLLRSIPLHDEVKGQLRFLQWSKTGCASNGQTTCAQRVLCASSTHVSVFDAADENWVAEIDAGDGTTFVHVDFTPSPDEVICFFEFNVQLMISSLKTGEQRVIRTPKFSGSNGYAFRPKSGHLALLLKIEGNDVLSIHEPQTYECITTAALQIVDVQGLKWSPNGAWIAVWGAALVGTAVAIYTADGQYFRTYTGAENEIGFGVKTIEWSPDSRVLALGKQGGSVELINGQTVSCCLVLRLSPSSDDYSRSLN